MNTWLDGSIAIYECVEGFLFSVDSDMSLECTGQWPNADNIKCGMLSEKMGNTHYYSIVSANQTNFNPNNILLY